MKQNIKYTIFAATSIFTSFMIAFLVIEIFLRILAPSLTYLVTPGRRIPHPHTGWANTPNFRGVHQSFDFYSTFTHNTDGFRSEKNFSQVNKPITLVLGDSMVFGWGVSDGEDFCSQLNQTRSDRYHMNCGVIGYNTVQQFLQLKELTKDMQPESVIFCLYWNDLPANARPVTHVWAESHGPTFTTSINHKRIAQILDPNKKGYQESQPLLWKIRTIGYVYALINKARLEKQKIEIWKKDTTLTHREENLALDLTKKIISTTIDISEDKNYRMIFLWLPDLEEVDPESKEAKHCPLPEYYFRFKTQMNHYLQDKGIVMWDPTPFLRNKNTDQPTHFKNDRHLTAFGHAMIAKYIDQKYEETAQNRLNGNNEEQILFAEQVR